MLVLLLLLSLPSPSGLPCATTGVASDVRYVLEHRPATDPAAEPGSPQAGAWIVEVTLSGSRAGTTVVMELSDWGGWRGTSWPHVTLLEAEPEPVRADPAGGRFEFEVPRRGRGRVRLRYSIALLPMHGELQRGHGLLPAAGPDYAFGYSWNTLVQVSERGGPLAGRRSIELRAPADTTIVSGWAGLALGRQEAELEPAMGNAPIAFGLPAARSGGENEKLAVEVYQFGAGADISDVVAGLIASSAPALGRRFGLAPRNPYRAFVTDHAGGGMGSHFGLRVGQSADEPPGRRDSPWLKAFVLHELIHDWLGIAVSDQDEELVWFKEGFTEYLAQWQAAAAGLVGREYFLRRLLELEEIARSRSALGKVAFGAPGVGWRDGDGPLETLAYTGAPLLAFLMDVELVEAKRPGLSELVRDLIATGERSFTLADLCAWCRAHGLGERWRRSVEGTELPALITILERAGFRRIEQATDLTYFGLDVQPPGLGGRIVGIDPAGPAARAGFRIEDLLTGFWPARAEPARPRADPGPYGFGLGLFVPGETGTYIGVRRGAEALQLFVDPLVRKNEGVIDGWGTESRELERFFAR